MEQQRMHVLDWIARAEHTKFEGAPYVPPSREHAVTKRITPEIAGYAALTPLQVQTIRDELDEGDTIRKVAERHKISPAVVRKIQSGYNE